MNGEASTPTAAPGELYLVATPIGNLQDLSLRALDVLRRVDSIAAEDTRVTSRLLAHHGIGTPTFALHAHNERAGADRVVGLLSQGKNVALVSDAGTPGISDPGAIVARAAREAGYRVIPIPGASSLTAALSVAGMEEDSVLFRGFLPAKSGARRAAIAELRDLTSTLVFLEAPHRVLECIEDLALELAGDQPRRIVIARELTKLFESVHECALAEAASWLREDANRQRGEFVLLVSGNAAGPSDNDWERILGILLDDLPLAQAVRLTCQITGEKRKVVYEKALALKSDSSGTTQSQD
jgi:16S rRNA (cytidine1402-2'-O)-methyltransferase